MYPVAGLGEFYMSKCCDILVVDDQQGVRRLLQEVLTEQGYEVVTAANGIKALDMLSRLKPRAVILDMKMPGLDGLETLKKLRERNSEIPVIMMTAYGELDTEERFQQYGVRQFLVKPFDLNDVCFLIKKVLEPAEKPGNFQNIGR